MRKPYQSGSVLFRIVLCTVIIALAMAGFFLLKNMKKPPAQTAAVEHRLPVDGLVAELSAFQVLVSGFGEVRSRSVLPLAAEVSGRVTAIHPRLEAGEIIEQGEVLIALDDRDQRLEHETAEARLQKLRRDLELAVGEYERLKSLYESSRTGSLSTVEKAESGVNAVADRVSQIEQVLESSRLRIERSVIRAPFTCRVTEVMVEQHEYVTPGKQLLTITNDADLEITVPLDGHDVIRWLEFDPKPGREGTNWFASPVQKECSVEWVEESSIRAKGIVDRIVRYDPKTRTMMVAIRLEGDVESTVPLVDGMFCKVSIPGMTLEQVVVLPRHAVSFENTVYVAKDSRLQTRPVKVVRLEEEKAVIGSGLKPGEIVITTRLEQPLENSLLQVNLKETEQK